MIDDQELAEVFAKARDYAALSVEFDPLAAIASGFSGRAYDAPLAARVMGLLRAECTDAAGGKRWIMRQSPRDRLLIEIRADGTTRMAPSLGEDNPVAVTMRSAVFGDGTLDTRIEMVLASPRDNIGDLTELARAVELAGSGSKATYGRLPELRSTLNSLQAVRQAEGQLAQGYFGNEALRDRLAAWIDDPPDDSFARAIYIGGIPGVGKSFLLTKLVQEARGRTAPIVLTLDFDRRGLNLVEPESLAMELSRQLGNELPNQAAEQADLRARLSNEQALESLKRRGTIPFALIERMGGAVRRSGRTVLLILDTLEVLAAYGTSHPARLFEFLDDLLRAGLTPAAIIAAGRGEALKSLGSKRLARFEPLVGLPEHAARMMLVKLEAPSQAIPRILTIARGNPLLLRLAARLAREAGVGAIEFDRVAGKAPEVAGAYLYRAILSRIDDLRLREIAGLGLVLERISPEAIVEVIAPALGLSLTVQEAESMLTELATHHWLVEHEPDPRWVRHRSDVRQVILPLLYAESREQVAAVNRAAAKFFAPLSPVDSVYHELQSMEDDAAVAPVDPAIAWAFTDQMVDELPAVAADAVLRARGERSRTYSGDEAKAMDLTVAPVPLESAGPPKAVPPDPSATLLADLRLMLERGDLIEAHALFAAYVNLDADPATPGGIATLCYLWFGGQWAKAERLFRQLEAVDFHHETWDGADVLVRLVVLEMRAEFSFDSLVAEFERNEDFLRQAQYTYRDAKTLRLYEGPLAFALLAERRPTTISGGWREAIGASGTGLADPSIDEYCLGDVRSLRERHGMPVDMVGVPAWEVAAALNPHVGPISTLLSIRRNSLLTKYVNVLTGGITALLDFPFGSDEGNTYCDRLLNRAEDVVSHLGALGTTADWLSAFTFFKQTADVPSIARRAEAWRRTAAGQWVYGSTPPLEWAVVPYGIDRGATTWLDRISARPDAVDEAARQLLFWLRPCSDEDQRQAGPPKLGRREDARLVRALRLARRSARRVRLEPQRAALRALMAQGIGRSIAVPVAVIASRPSGQHVDSPWLEQLAKGSDGLRTALMEE